jgi:RNA polymerase sigma factor (sigma-70 family)
VAKPVISPELALLRALFPEEPFRERLEALCHADEDTLRKQLRRQMDMALDTLSYRERGILEMRYGLGDGYAYTLVESGYVFKLTQERIRQLQGKSLRKLRQRAPDLRDFLVGLGPCGRGGLQQNRR